MMRKMVAMPRYSVGGYLISVERGGREDGMRVGEGEEDQLE